MTARTGAITTVLFVAGLVVAITQRTPTSAQYDRRMAPRMLDAPVDRMPRLTTIHDFHWGRPVAPAEIKVHDIVTILVDEKSEVTLNSRFDRQRNAEFEAALEEFIRLASNGSVQNTAQTSPTIDATSRRRFQSTGRSSDSEGIRYRIAATVVDVRPNGNLVLEARKKVQTNQDYWEYSLTGVLRPGDILPNNTALSENIANLEIAKNQKGRIYGSTKLGWGSRLIDWAWPF